MKRRRAETLTEFLVAMMVFATIMAGVFEFVANQTTNAGRIKDYDFFMYYTQKWLNEKGNTIPSSGKIENTERYTIEFTVKDGILTATQGNKSMKFTVSSN